MPHHCTIAILKGNKIGITKQFSSVFFPQWFQTENEVNKFVKLDFLFHCITGILELKIKCTDSTQFSFGIIASPRK